MGGGNTPPTLRRNMLLSELITELQYRVEDDSDDSRFPESQKIDAINNAYYTLISIADSKTLGKFKLTKSNISLLLDDDTGYSYYRFSRGPKPLRIANAKSGGGDCKILTKDELFSLSPHYKYGVAMAVCSNYNSINDSVLLYVTPKSISTLVVWHTRQVENLTLNNQYPITDSLKPILLGLAESELWRSDNANSRAKEAYAEAINILQAQEGK